MRSPWVCFVACLALAAAQQVPFSIFQPSTEIRSTNLTDMVQWDGYSMFVLGQRLILWSGEIHRGYYILHNATCAQIVTAWRILTPALYLDVMQRIKALGFNAISMYTFWGLHNPAPGVLDFDDWKNLDPFFEAANEAGLWVVARPGPYIVSILATSAADPTCRTQKSPAEGFRDG
jgi:beta-galactosidase GanA